jgi:hypothetical protein
MLDWTITATGKLCYELLEEQNIDCDAKILSSFDICSGTNRMTRCS